MGLLSGALRGAKAGGKLAKFLLSVSDDAAVGGTRLMNAGEMAFRLAPDIGFSVLSAARTPGDLSDKLLVGGTQFLGGTVTGLSAGRAFRNPALSGTADTLASVVGDQLSIPVADVAMRGKDKLMGGKGETPFERLSREDREIFRQQITEQVLAAYGLLPGTRNQYLAPDPTMAAIGG